MRKYKVRIEQTLEFEGEFEAESETLAVVAAQGEIRQWGEVTDQTVVVTPLS